MTIFTKKLKYYLSHKFPARQRSSYFEKKAKKKYYQLNEIIRIMSVAMNWHIGCRDYCKWWRCCWWWNIKTKKLLAYVIYKNLNHTTFATDHPLYIPSFLKLPRKFIILSLVYIMPWQHRHRSHNTLPSLIILMEIYL